MTTIDAHAHVIVPELLRAPGASQEWRPSVHWRDGRQVVEFAGRAMFSAVDEFVELDGILAVCDRRGIDHVLLCPWVPLLFGALQGSKALRRCLIENEGLARLREKRPERVSVLGAVPLQDPALAARALHELMDSGRFSGVEIATCVAGRYLGEDYFEPFWAAAEQTGALVFIHPTTRGFEAPVFEEHYLWNLVGNPFETTTAAAHLAMSGTLERHPDLRVLLAHAGGAIVTLRGRLRRGQEAVIQAGAGPREPVDAAIGRFYLDTITHDPVLLRALVETAGADRVLLGSDYPFDMGDPDPVGTVRAARLGAEAERAVLGGNAERLLGLTAPVGS